MREILIFYLFIVAFYLLYINHMVSSYTENFSGIIVTTNNPVGQCYECTAFYSQLLGLTDSSQIMPEMTALNNLFDNFFASLDTFLQDQKTICENVATISDFIDCMTNYVNKLPCPVGLTQADCVIRNNILTTIISKANICSDGGNCKTLSDFTENIVIVLASIKEDYATCKNNFANATSACVKQYSDVISINQAGNTDTENQQANDESTLMTKADLNNALFDTTTYITTIGYKG